MTRTLLTAALLVILLPGLACSSTPIQDSGEKETPAEKARRLDRMHTAIMSYNSYAAPLSWDRKTVIMIQDGTVVAEEIYSPNREYHAKADMRSGRTTVYQNVRQGRFGRRVEQWSVAGCHEMLGLTDDGEILILGCRTEDRVVRNDDAERIVLTMVRRGEVVREMRFADLAAAAAAESGAESGTASLKYTKLNAAGYYVIETGEGRPVCVDPAGGRTVQVNLAEAGEAQNWRRHVDIYHWFELQYPEPWKLHCSRQYEGYPTGDLTLARPDAAGGVEGIMERISDHAPPDGPAPSFREFAVKRAQVLQSADGPTSSVYCDSVLSLQSFTTPHGIEVLKMHLSVVRAEWTDEEETRVRSVRGPIYALLLAPRAAAPHRVLFLSPTRRSDPATADDIQLQKIVATVRYPD